MTTRHAAPPPCALQQASLAPPRWAGTVAQVLGAAIGMVVIGVAGFVAALAAAVLLPIALVFSVALGAGQPAPVRAGWRSPRR